MSVLSKIVIDTVPVILGVFIGLLMNDWKASVDDQRYMNRVMAAVTEQIRSNHESIEDVLPRQKRTIDALKAAMSDDNKSVEDVLDASGGIQVPGVLTTAWQPLLRSKIELVDYELLAILTEIEEAKRLMILKMEGLTAFGQSNRALSKQKRTYASVIENVIDSEQHLLRLHKRFLEVYAQSRS